MTMAIFTEIALGTARAADARELIHSVLQDVTENSARQLYTALRAWVWKALDGRRRDDELREWFDLLKRASAALKSRHAVEAARIGVLHDLIYESISASEIMAPADVLQREHVRRILKSMARYGGRMDRTKIGDESSLKQANLTRILNMMSSARLIERTVYGRRAIFELTKLGEEEVARMRHRTRPSQVVQPASRFASAPHLAGSSDAADQLNWVARRLLGVRTASDLANAAADAEETARALEAQRKNLSAKGVQPVPVHATTYLEEVGGDVGIKRVQGKATRKVPLVAPQERMLAATPARKDGYEAAIASADEKEKLYHAI